MAEGSKHQRISAPGWRRDAFSGWGRLARAEMLAARPERASELAGILTSAGSEGIIVHAGGRSYGDSALNAGGRAILTRRLDRLLAFDPASGPLVAEAGVRFEDLRRVLLPRGFLAPVTPGTAFATLGGAVAHDGVLALSRRYVLATRLAGRGLARSAGLDLPL